MTSPVNIARLQLVALWIAVFARAVGENAVRTYAIIKLGNGRIEPTFGLLFILLGLSAVTVFGLTPLAGAVACSRWRWPAMILSTAVGLGAIGWSSFEEYDAGQTFWPGCFTALAVESAFFAACCFSIIPQAARNARVSLPQLNGLFAVAVTAGMLLGLWIGVEQFPQGRHGLPVPLQFGHIGYGLALVFILLARFRPENPLRIHDGLIMPLARTALAIFRDRNGRNSLLVAWGLFAVGLAVSQWMLPDEIEARYRFYLAVIIGAAAGGLHFHPFRTLGAVPYGMTVVTVCSLWAFASGDWSSPAIGIGFSLGLMAPSLLTAYQIHQPDDRRGHGAALLFGGCAMISGAFLFLLVIWTANPPASKPVIAAGIFCLSISGLVFTWVVFFRPAAERTVEWLLWPFYRIRATGPGVHALPWKGPVIVIANHAAWFDPLWLTKIVPFAPTPMMTSKFFDLPVIGWFVRKVMGAVRVPDVVMRKEAPEISQVIAALDRGECMFIFPEGWLRRKEDQELRRFGRGIWQILTERPQVPIFACWIDGSWGSFVSYRNGPPMKNKRLDFWRPIRIAVLEPFKVDAASLEKHMTTRMLLMHKVLEARALLGLPPIDPFKLPVRDEGEGEDEAEPPEAAKEGSA